MVQLVNTLDRGAVEQIDAEAVNSAQRRSLYAARVKVQPKATDGTFRRLKWAILAVCLGIYYVAPWLRWERGGDAPDQAILVDLANRRFYFFFIEIWPQEFYYVAGLLIMAGIGLFLVTSLFGRAWCGYACPQTVWTDLFMAVEAWAEGDRNARLRLDAAPLSFAKLRKRTLKLAVWLLIAVATGGFWVFYFADAPALFRELITGAAAPVAYFTVAILTATTFTFAGFMREQVCTYMCPWPRIQAAMLDEHSLVVTYNAWRGEPRQAGRKRAEAQGLAVGDCVDCNACVAACPMGIDIREGNQLECINCALCIDACDSVMDKVGSPRGLISYSTSSLYAANAAGQDVRWTWRALIRPRTAIYFAAWAAVGLVMLVTLVNRDRFDVNIVPDRNPLYVKLADGAIRNGYTVKILNMKQERRTFRIALDGLPGATMQAEGEDRDPVTALTVTVEADKLHAVKLFVATASETVRKAEATGFRFEVAEVGSAGEPEAGSFEAVFHAPGE
jgi:cytochrome c oxidase accessory protein FixG